MPIIETEVWVPNPENGGRAEFSHTRKAKDVFDDLERHLKADGRLPDEYFSFDIHGNWSGGKEFPVDGEIFCKTDFGASEGVYINIYVRYREEVQEHNKGTSKNEIKTQNVTQHFATGKTLGDTIDDLDKMNLVAASVTAGFYSNRLELNERYDKIKRGEIIPPYPQPSKTASRSGDGLQRYTNIDLELHLGKIAEQVIIHSPEDWTIIMNELRKIALSGNYEDSRVYWHVCSYGTHLCKESDTFITDTTAHNTVIDFYPTDKDTFIYFIEVTGFSGQRVMGDVYEVGNSSEFAKYIRDVAEPLESVTVFYSGINSASGSKIANFNADDYRANRSDILTEHGQTLRVYHPKDKVRLATLVTQERTNRTFFSIGTEEQLLQKVTDKLAELRSTATIIEPASHKIPDADTLAKKMQTASERVKEQDTQPGKTTSPNWEER